MKDYIKNTRMNGRKKYNYEGDLKEDLAWFSVSVIVVVLFVLALFYGAQYE